MFKIMCVFLFSFSVGALAQSPASASGWTGGLLPISTQDIPNRQAITSWSAVEGYTTTSLDVLRLPRIPVNCTSKDLYPTHPQQSSKLYHAFEAARYDHFKLRADDEACLVSSPNKSSSREPLCLNADYLEYAVLSDIYQDACGNLYRGVWDVAFLKKNDSMAILFAKGRTLYQKPHSEFENDMYVAQTYPVNEEDFLFLTPLFTGDLEKVQKLKSEALLTHDYNPRTFLFSPQLKN